MPKKIAASVFLVVIFLVANAHEFWLEPQRFQYQVGEEMKVDFMVGENFTGEFWDLKRHRVESLRLYSISGQINLLEKVTKTVGSNLRFKLEKVGTHMLVMQSNTAYIELEAEKFNAYLKEDGLDYIADARKKTNTTDKPSRENYTRYAKLLVQTGNKTDETFKQKAGLRLEIVPDKNPYVLKSGDYLQCLIMFEGKPSPHTLVKVWSRLNRTTFLQNIYTENDGMIKFPISTSGVWMVSTVKMIPSESAEADWHSLWGSLVFGIR